MKTLYVDCFSGISGDMFLAALLNLGLDQEHLTQELTKLPLAGYNIQITQAQTGALAGTLSVSGGDISPDGREIVIRTGDTAFVWPRGPGQSVVDVRDTFFVEDMAPGRRQQPRILPGSADDDRQRRGRQVFENRSRGVSDHRMS